jgi:hypothetical protein
MRTVPHAESRICVRVHYCDPVTAQPLGGPTGQHGLSLLAEDLSESGVRLSSPQLLAVDTPLLLAFEPTSWQAPIRAVGRVVWVAQPGASDQWDIGVAFTELSDGERERLRALVASRQDR